MPRIFALLSVVTSLIAVSVRAETPLPKVELSDRTAEPLIKAEKPWESFTIGFPRVIRVGDTWHMWYMAYDSAYRNDADYSFCYAKSADGVRWERPNLGMTEYGGNTDNNIIAKGNFGSGVFLDAHAPPAQRFKCVFIQFFGNEWCLYGATSPDGLHWTRLAEPLLTKNTDTDNVCFVDDHGVYRFYVRMWTDGLYKGHRVVGYTESRTFGGPLPDPKVILGRDAEDANDLHFYNSAAAKLGESLYVMFPSGYTKSDDLVRPHLALSRDGVTFDRVGRAPVMELGKGFDRAGIYVSAAPVPLEKPGEFWFYYAGTPTPHDRTLPDKVKYDGGFGRFRVKITGAK